MRLGRAGVLAATNKKRREQEKQRQVLQDQQRERRHEIELSENSGRDEEAGSGRYDGSVIDGSNPEDYGTGVVVNIQENINLKEKSRERLVFRKLPFTLWVVGTIVILASIYLIYHLAGATWGVLFEGYQEG